MRIHAFARDTRPVKTFLRINQRILIGFADRSLKYKVSTNKQEICPNGAVVFGDVG